MGCVYVLYSKLKDRFYIGSCADFDLRFEQHKDKTFFKSFTAQQAGDWELFLKIDKLAYEESRWIEEYIKAMKSRIYIHNLKKYPEMINKLKTKYVDGGSSR